MMVTVPIAGELKFFPFSGAGLRLSLGTAVFFFLLLLARKINPILAGGLTGSAIVFFRSFLEIVHSSSLHIQDAFRSNFPGFIYYLVFASLFYLFKINSLHTRPFLIGLLGVLIEIIANFAEISIRHFTSQMQISAFTFLFIGGVAIIRSFFVLGFFTIIILRETKIAEEQQRSRNEQMLLLISNLYVEMFQLEKSTKNAEALTSTCYTLYRYLKNQENHEQSQTALKIAGELHEIKKDNQRIFAGLSKLLAKEKLADFMSIEEIISVIIHSNKNYSEMFNKTIDFQVAISGEHPPYNTYLLLSLINNLAANAVEAIKQAGEIMLTVERIHDTLTIRIKDNGSGISPKNKPLIFDPGFTTKYDDTGIASNGIGLSYIKNVIESLSGEINLMDLPKTEGTAFEIQLPVESLTKEG